MSDAAIPSHFGQAIRWAVASVVIFVTFMVGWEKLNDGIFLSATCNFVFCLVAFVIAVKWDSIRRGRELAFIFIFVGVVCLTIGITLLSYAPRAPIEQPVVAPSETSPNGNILSRIPADDQSAMEIKKLQAQLGEKNNRIISLESRIASKSLTQDSDQNVKEIERWIQLKRLIELTTQDKACVDNLGPVWRDYLIDYNKLMNIGQRRMNDTQLMGFDGCVKRLTTTAKTAFPNETFNFIPTVPTEYMIIKVPNEDKIEDDQRTVEFRKRTYQAKRISEEADRLLTSMNNEFIQIQTRIASTPLGSQVAK